MSSLKNKIAKIFPNTSYFFLVSYKKIREKLIHDKKGYLVKRYKKKFRVDFNVDNPSTFYEKITFLKLKQEGEIFQKMIDKNLVKDYLSTLNLNNHCTKTIASFYSFREFKKSLKGIIAEHNDFVVKLAHTSGDVFFYNNGAWRDKKGCSVRQYFVFAVLRNKIKYNYYWQSFEKIYDHLKGSILVEEYRPSLNNKGLNEIKLFVNYGKPVLINYVEGRQNGGHVKEAFLDANLNKLPVKQDQDILDIDSLDKPLYYEQLLDFCKDTCSNFPLVRVDFMCSSDEFTFCEFTFYDCSGCNIFYPLEYNKKLGDLIIFKKELYNKQTN